MQGGNWVPVCFTGFDLTCSHVKPVPPPAGFLLMRKRGPGELFGSCCTYGLVIGTHEECSVWARAELHSFLYPGRLCINKERALLGLSWWHLGNAVLR